MALSLAEVIAAKKAKEAAASAQPATTPIAMEANKQKPVATPAATLAEEILQQVEAPTPVTTLVPLQTIKVTRTVPNHEDILPRIRALEAMATEQLDDEMKLLKEALLQNPSAVSLMLPEDIGMCVAALRRITGDAVVKATTEKSPKSKKKLTAEEMDQAWSEL